MPKEEWGTKRICPTTGKRFYDLNRSPIVSPYTGDVVVIDTSKAGRMMVADKPDRAAKEKATEEEEAVVLEDDDAEIEDETDDEVLEDDSDDDVSLDDIADVAGDGDDD